MSSKMNNGKMCTVLHWNYRGFTKFPIDCLTGEEEDVTDIYLKENLISRVPNDIGKLRNLESLYLSGNDIVELPAEISSLRCLKCLDLSGNRLRRIPDEIGEMRGLKFLILDENELHSLPTRIGELRALRYLSVCDNKLQWLPQRPVYNYYHCEFKFWRNIDLKTIPYSLWYHMFRDQQTRSLNIGCLNMTDNQQNSRNIRCRLAIYQDSRLCEIGVSCPPEYINIIRPGAEIPPSLYELTRRTAYQMISMTSKKLNINRSTDVGSHNFYKDNSNRSNNNINKMEDLQKTFSGFQLDKINNINCETNESKTNSETSNRCSWSHELEKSGEYYVPCDILNNLFPYLPHFVKKDLCNGPMSYCENAYCKKPIFDYVYYEYCLEKIILFDSTENVILNVTFCSKACGNFWKSGKLNIIPWKLVK